MLKQDAGGLVVAAAAPAAFRRLCVETVKPICRINSASPAAFRRLCVETIRRYSTHYARHQPPLGGCVLKLSHATRCQAYRTQPPLGGCVLKLLLIYLSQKTKTQPPLGGCVLKPRALGAAQCGRPPAAFRRLCVETYRVRRTR